MDACPPQARACTPPKCTSLSFIIFLQITPAHDPNDFKTGKRHNLASINVFDDDGCINEQGGEFAGQPRFKVQWVINEWMGPWRSEMHNKQLDQLITLLQAR